MVQRCKPAWWLVVVALLAVAAIAMVPSEVDAAVCAPHLDGHWAGDFSMPITSQRGTWAADLEFSGTSLTGTATVTSRQGSPVTEPPVPLSGTVDCNELSFQAPDDQSVFTGTLGADGRSAGGVFFTNISPGLWSLTFVAPPAPTVSVGSAQVQEGNNGTGAVVEIPVTLSRSSTSTLKVNYFTFVGEATAADYIDKAGVITFTPGGNGLTPVTKWIKVTIRGDLTLETDETFGVGLYNPVGGTINNDTGTVTIQDDDNTAGPVLTISGTSVYEGEEGKRDLRLTVWLSQPAAAPVAVEYSTGDGTAIAPSDYRPKSDDLTFKAGQVRKVVTIRAVPDDVAEGVSEQFFGYLLAALGAPIDRNQTTFTIFEE